MVRRLFIPLLGAVAFPFFLHAEDPPMTVTVGGSGDGQVYEVAADELYFEGGGFEKIAAQKTLQALSDFVGNLAAASARIGFLVLYPEGMPRTEANRRILTDKIVVEADAAGAAKITRLEGVQAVEKMPLLPGYLEVTVLHPARTVEIQEKIRRLPEVTSAEAQVSRQMHSRAVPNDTLFSAQWHLRNTGQFGGTSGIDVNPLNAWNTYRGSGVTIGILDDGVDATHPDLAPNIAASLGYDFNDRDAIPLPSLKNGDFHGTSAAGVAAARGFNGLGVCGVAPLAKIASLRLIAKPSTDAQEASAFAFRNEAIAIKSNSWGPDDIGTIDGPGRLGKLMLQKAALQGRGGLGTIFVWAGGNGRQENDNSNYDGYANSIYTIAVGAVGDDGIQADYSESGANLVVCAPSDTEGGRPITSTDIAGPHGYNHDEDSGFEPSDEDYTGSFGGTSAACPAVAGVVALMLQANSDLKWNDVQSILIRTARKNNSSSSDWKTNDAGLSFNHKYGAGLVDAKAAVDMALAWVGSPGTLTQSVAAANLPRVIPDNNSGGVEIPLAVTSEITSLEHVVLTFSATHRYRGDLRIVLRAPSGFESVLAEQRDEDPGRNYRAWEFSSVRHWGENPNGTWILKVSDGYPGDTGKVTAVALTLYGTNGSGIYSVTCSVGAPASGGSTSASRVKVTGTAFAPGGLRRIEYCVAETKTGWLKARGLEAWSINLSLKRGATRTIYIRAVSRTGIVSPVQTFSATRL